MRAILYLSVVLVVCYFAVSITAANSNGWGEGISWHSLAEAKQQAKAHNKPIMVIMHQEWCGACKRLKPLFAESSEILDLSKHFLMVNAQDKEAPHDNTAFKLDGEYVPKIVFLDSEGNLSDIQNADGNPKYMYFYPTVSHIINSMKRALAKQN